MSNSLLRSASRWAGLIELEDDERRPRRTLIDYPEPATGTVAGGLLLLAALFMIRAFVAEAVKKAGKEFRGWM